MGLFSTIVNGFNNVNTWLDDARDLLNGSLESNEYKELKDQVTDNTVFMDSGRFVSQDEVLRRFHLGNEFQSDSHNDVFAPGFEDPARLMFKIEFGDWGNSLLDIETIRNQQVTNKSSNVYFENYDQFPMGLLDLNFGEFRNNNDWNIQTSYNAYNYLLNNNEDARAQYIQQFVKGLYVIQKDMPYIFQSISGVDKLQEFNTTQGKRIKDVQLTLKCIEGIDLKIKTLLELYRKAAYDEVWQRWILPDIYRYFKMIIYVFDRRILHTGIGTYSTDQDYFPIYAFECGPCEFQIGPTYDNEFFVDYGNHKNVESQIIINVKNVKTYYSNKLFNKIDTLIHKINWISDFDSVKERQSYTSVNSDNHENFKTRWMRRMFMTPSEYRAYYKNITHKFGREDDFKKLYGTNEIYGPIIPKNTWHQAVVTDPIYTIDSWDGLRKYFKKLLLTRTTLIRDSRTDDKEIMQNTLSRPFMPLYDYYPNMIMYNNFTKHALTLMRHHIEIMLQQMLNNTYIIDTSVYYNLKDPGLINNYTKLNLNMVNNTSMYLDKPHHDMISPIFDEHKYKLNMVNNTSMYLDKPEHDMISPIFDEHKYKLNMVNNTSMYLDKPEHNMVKPIFDEHKNELNMVNNTSMYLDKPEHNMVKPIFDEHKNELNMVNNTSMYLDKPEHNMISPYFNLDKTLMNMIEPEFNLDKTDLLFVEPIFNNSKAIMNLIIPENDLSKHGMTYVEPEYDEHKAKLKLIPDKQDNHKTTMNLIPDNQDNHKTNMNLIPDNQDNHKANMNLIPDNQDNHKANMNFIPDEQDEHKANMNLIPDEQDNHKANMNLIPDEQDNHKANMNLILDEQDEHKVNMNLIPDDQDNHKANMNLIPDDQDNHKANMNLIPDEQDTRKSNTQMIPQVINASIPNMEFIIPYNNTSTGQMDFVHPDMNTSIPDMDFVYPDMNTSIPDIDFVYPDMNTSIPNMDFVHPDMNTSIPDMKFISPDMNSSIPDMKFISPNMNTSIPNMKFISPDMNTSIANMNFVYPDMNSSIPDMDFVIPDMNTSTPLLNFIYPEFNTSIPVMDFIHQDINTSIPEMNFIYPTMNTSISDMVMVQPIQNVSLPKMTMIQPNNNNSIPDMKFISPEFNDKLNNISFVKPIIDVSKTNMVMNKFDYNIDKPNIDMVPVTITDDKVKQQMLIQDNSIYDINMLMVNNNIDMSKPEMKMYSTDLNSSIPNMQLTDNLINDVHKPEMKMVELTQDTSLVNKLMALTQIDVNDLKTTDIENLLSLADIIEHTVEEIKERSQQMKLTDNIPEIPKHVHMKMTSIPQPPRRQFIVDKLNSVDQVAIDRAWEAKRNAENSEERTGNRY